MCVRPGCARAGPLPLLTGVLGERGCVLSRWRYWLWFGGGLEVPASAGIPLRLVSLAASPLRFAKGGPPLSFGHFPHEWGKPWPCVHPWVPAFAGMTVGCRECWWGGKCRIGCRWIVGVCNSVWFGGTLR